MSNFKLKFPITKNTLFRLKMSCHNLNYFEVKCELRCVVDIFTL